MSELKVHKAYNRWLDEEMPTPNDDLICNDVYLKYEADKVIARHKYKRCLAMADYAEAESCYHTTLANGFWLLRNNITKRDEERRIAKRWDKWQNRWLALADKFKEAK